MKILVTGASGQLGLSLHRELESRFPGITDYMTHHELDITDSHAVDQIIATGGYTHIINAAAYTAVDMAEEDKGHCTAVNVDGIRNIAKAAGIAGTKVIHISTDYVFDGAKGTPYNEAEKPSPLSYYGLSKRKGEMILLGLLPDAIIVRTGWLYSPFGKNFVKTILRKLNNGDRLSVVSDQIGTPTSAFDLARVIVNIIASRKWISGIYHFSNEGVASWYDFAMAIKEISGLDADVRPIMTTDYPSPAIRPLYSVLDKSRIRATYPYRIPYWKDALKEVISEINLNTENI